MKYYLIAGEASGDLHASHLMKALKNEDPEANFRFFGGDLMQAEGGTLVRHYKDLAFMGILPVIKNLPTILANMRFCKNDIKAFAPDVVILIDYPGFNMKIAQYVKEKLNLPVYYYISPKIWAWKEYRIKSIRKYVDKMYCILPFEVDFYKKHNYKVTYVGNPTVDEICGKEHDFLSRKEFLKKNGLNEKPIVALLAGSRKQEIQSNLNIMLNAAKDFKEYQFVIAGAPSIEKEFYHSVIKEYSCNIVFGQTYELLNNSEAALVTSGTATLETALWNIPQVVCYHMGVPKPIYELFRPMIKVKFVSLVNLVANKEVCKELLGYNMTIPHVRKELEKLLYDSDYRREILHGYKDMKEKLGPPGAPIRAAGDIYKSLSGRSQK